MKALWIGRVSDEPDFRPYTQRVCGCTTCRHWRGDETVWRKLRCDLCRREPNKDWPYICVPFVPEMIKTFLAVENICHGCRNTINHHLTEWSACWTESTEDHLKWALTAYVLESYYNNHWYMHNLKNKTCCKVGHRNEERLAA